jgi:hypothetical protein
MRELRMQLTISRLPSSSSLRSFSADECGFRDLKNTSKNTRQDTKEKEHLIFLFVRHVYVHDLAVLNVHV